MKAPASTLEELVEIAAREFASQVKDTAGDDPNIRTAVLKMAIRDASWNLLKAFPSLKHEISEMLDLMGQLVRDEEMEE